MPVNRLLPGTLLESSESFSETYAYRIWVRALLVYPEFRRGACQEKDRRDFMKTRIHLREPVFVALETLRAHKLRSFLMLLGIVLSVSTLIMVVALISGVNLYVADRVANLGSNVFLVLRFPIIPDVNEFVKATRRNKPMTWDDYLYLRDNTKLAVRVGAQAYGVGRTKANGQSVEDTTIYGVTANIGDMKTEEPAQGRYITDADN